MKKIYAALPILLFGFYSCDQPPKEIMEEKEPISNQIVYPESKKGDVVDDYFGTKVSDPYRWLEDDNSEETKQWVIEQNKVTDAFLDEIPGKEKIKSRLTGLWDYPKVSAPFKRGDYYYISKNEGLQAQSVLYQMDKLGGEESVFLDPNTFSEDGTVSLAGASFSEGSKYFAYGISEGGSDWNTWFVMDMETHELIDDKILWTKFGGLSWYKDEGFFYTRFPEPQEGQALSGANRDGKIFYHTIGQKQSDDLLIWEDTENPTYYNFGGLTEDMQYFILTQSQGTHGQNLKVLPMPDPKDLVEKPEFLSVIDDFENDHNVVTTLGKDLMVMTNKGAENYRLVRINVNSPKVKNWKEILPEGESVLQSVSTGGEKLFVTYLKDASSQVFIHSYDGKQTGKVDLPTLGTAGGFGAKKGETEFFYSFTSYTYPTTIYRYDIASNTSEMYSQSKVKFDPSLYETKEVFYPSADGEKVHMFITHKKGLKIDGQRPTLLYAYGGFNISLTPSFSLGSIYLLENDGVYCVANLRGGGEYGEKWHKAGMLENKQNVFNDFIAGGEYLIENGYTSSERLAIRGGSNGGLLVGACMVQRPDLFKVAFPAVGVLDMLRFHKFTVGAGWVVEYGSSDTAAHFPTLHAYSPYHNLKSGVNYPATMIMTADHDDRVVPAHSFKFAAQLQESHEGENPVLIRIETKAGHGAGKSTQQTIDEYADIWAFMFHNMDIEL